MTGTHIHTCISLAHSAYNFKIKNIQIKVTINIDSAEWKLKVMLRIFILHLLLSDIDSNSLTNY